MKMLGAHLLSRCSWQTEFDQQSRAVELQDFISEWSNTVLVRELDAYFDHVCPPTQTWRLGRLHLDLGEIPFDAMAQELPRRLRASLQEAFAHLQAAPLAVDTPVDGARSDALAPVDAPLAEQELVSWFLEHGQMPWWYRGDERFAELWDRQLEQAAPHCVQMVRELGQQESVRLRLVWQLGEKRVRRIVHLLEPWQGKRIGAFADELFVADSGHDAAVFSTRQFRDRTWAAILGYLLVDRGTLFNTTAFVRATLQRIAPQYQLSFHELLDKMHGALRALAPSGRINTPFLLAIESIHQQDQVKPAVLPAPVDHWALMLGWLRQPRPRVQVNDQHLTLHEVFCALAMQDPARMALLLRHAGQSASMRRGMVRLFSERELALAVRVLAPAHHEVILAHIAYSARALARHGAVRAPRLVWQIVLDYLLVQDMASFQLRQLIGATVEQLCKHHGVDLQVALDQLIFAALQLHSFAHRWQLQQIFCELKAAHQQRMASSEARSASRQLYREALLAYVLDGQAARRSGLPAQAIVRELLVNGTAAQFQALLADTRVRQSNAGLLCMRLLRLAGPGQLAPLFDLVQPDSGAFCLTLVAAWQQWRQRGALPSLARLDLALALPALMLQALPGFAGASPVRFDVDAFWLVLTRLLRHAGVDLAALAEQLHAAAADELCAAPEGRAALRPVTAVIDAARHSVWSRVWQRWATPMLSARNRASTAQPPSADSASLLRWLDDQAPPDAARRLLPALMRHPHDSEVRRWLQRDWPVALTTPDYAPDLLLQQCSALFRHSGYWHGTRAVLEQQLGAVFFTVLWDARKRHLSPAALLAKMLGNACLRLTIDLADCLGSFAGQPTLLDNTPWQAAVTLLRAAQTGQQRAAAPDSATPAAASVPVRRGLSRPPFIQDHLGDYLRDPRLLPIARHLLLHGRAPASLRLHGELDLTRLLFDLSTQQPVLLHTLLQTLHSAPDALFRLQQSMPLAWLLAAMQNFAPLHAGTIGLIASLHICLERTVLARVSRQQAGSALFVLVLRRWVAQAWSELDIQHLLKELALQLLRESGLAADALQQAFAPLLAGQPMALQSALRRLAAQPVQEAAAPASAPVRLDDRLKTMLRPERPRHAAEPMQITNAGLVILNGFFEPLFARLGLMEAGRFHDEQAQRRAVHFLQFLATGHRRTPEHHLTFNKVLCGLPLQTPLEMEIDMTESEMSLCESLLQSVMGYWSGSGDSGLDGFRGNWLVRNGSLNENGEHWQVVVEKRVYDILLDQAPFSYSMIRLQWMEKAVHVNWPTC